MRTNSRTARVFVMTDHPAWLETAQGRSRPLGLATGTCDVLVSPEGSLISPSRPSARMDAFCYPSAHDLPIPELEQHLKGLGVVHRFRNPSLWDAVVTAILRQVIRADQSKRLYRRLRDAYGEPCTCGRNLLLPSPETLSALTDDDYISLGLAFKAKTLRAAATSFALHEAEWRSLEGFELVDALAQVRGIGPWTARAAVADFGNAWECYPVDDLAVRTWARRAAPGYAWAETPTDFDRQWRDLAGDHVKILTLLLLAWASLRGTLG
jgi:DNA-3-methyladenine glycosylase II